MSEMGRIAGIASRALKDGFAFGLGIPARCTCGQGYDPECRLDAHHDQHISEAAADDSDGIICRYPAKTNGGNKMSAEDEMSEISEMSEAVKAVGDMLRVQGTDGNWNYNPYMHGMYNGLELALSVFEGRDPAYKEAPEKWIVEPPETADLRRQLAEAKALADAYHGQSDCYASAWKQRAEKAEAELVEAKAWGERLVSGIKRLGILLHDRHGVALHFNGFDTSGESRDFVCVSYQHDVIYRGSSLVEMVESLAEAEGGE